METNEVSVSSLANETENLFLYMISDHERVYERTVRLIKIKEVACL